MSDDTKKLEALRRFRSDFEYYAKNCLKIRDKGGDVQFFPGFNAPQRIVHDRIEQQRRETGKVRVLLLKARQQGMSTYIAARFYHRATLFRGINVFIMAHEQAASDSLFKIVDRFQINNPIRPHVGVSNVKELELDKLDSSYVVATAGQKAGGRGRTISLYHGSEVGFWQSAEDHFSASVQAVPDAPGTEIIIETTGNGATGLFYEKWQEAAHGRGDYIAVFIPWFVSEEYQRPVPPGFELSKEPGDTGMTEVEYAKLFKLTPEQMAWRRAKVSELGSVQLFDREYPADPDLAFSSADVKRSFILPIAVLRARNREDIVGAGPLIIGIDPSGPGKDRFSIAARQGLKVLWVRNRQIPETLEAVEWVKSVLKDEEPDKAFIDLGNIGHAIYSVLKASGAPFTNILKGVNFGATSQFKMAKPKIPGPRNRRAEMWDRLRIWLDLEEGVSLPDDSTLQSDITGPRVKPQVSGDFFLESKEEMKTRGVRSPDDADAVALTFAENERIISAEGRKERGSGPKRNPALPESRREETPTVFAPLTGGENAWMG